MLPAGLPASKGLVACSSRKQNSPGYPHIYLVKPAHAGERAALFLKFLNVAVAVSGAHDERIIPRRGGRPLGFPERPCQIAAGVINFRVISGVAVVETDLDTGYAAVEWAQ
jgi:hypothetical protein